MVWPPSWPRCSTNTLKHGVHCPTSMAESSQPHRALTGQMGWGEVGRTGQVTKPQGPRAENWGVRTALTVQEEVVLGDLPSSADGETEAQAGKRSKGSYRARGRGGLRTDRTPCRTLSCHQTSVTPCKPLHLSEPYTGS